MKIKAVESIIKANRAIYISKGDGCQWIGNGAAMYPLYGLPELSQENIFTMFDIPEDKREKYTFMQIQNARDLDNYPGEQEVYSLSTSIVASGALLNVYETSRGAVFLDARYLRPFRDDDISVFERIGDNGVYIAVKKGFFLAGIIAPAAVNAGQVFSDLKRIHASMLLAMRSFDEAEPYCEETEQEQSEEELQ